MMELAPISNLSTVSIAKIPNCHHALLINLLMLLIFITEYIQLLIDINSQVASFRDMLIHIGQKHDCPELRAKIRKTRRACVESCQSVSKIILPQIRR